ncbi:unnamed protein product [Closterium sp. NIES-65]|nr:unnamed protein product [Closterium sp. NIES-65]
MVLDVQGRAAAERALERGTTTPGQAEREGRGVRETALAGEIGSDRVMGELSAGATCGRRNARRVRIKGADTGGAEGDNARKGMGAEEDDEEGDEARIPLIPLLSPLPSPPFPPCPPLLSPLACRCSSPPFPLLPRSISSPPSPIFPTPPNYSLPFSPPPPLPISSSSSPLISPRLPPC